MDPAIVADEGELEECIRPYLPFLFFSIHPGWLGETLGWKSSRLQWLSGFVKHAICIISMYTREPSFGIPVCRTIQNSVVLGPMLATNILLPSHHLFKNVKNTNCNFVFHSIWV
jgi:hypothetical protein